MRRSAFKKLTIALLCLVFSISLISASNSHGATDASPYSRPAFSKPKVLIFSKTNGYHHASIATGIEAIKKLGAENGFEVDTTTDSLQFRKKILKKYAALIFLSPTGKVFGPDEEQALQEYIHHGGGFVGVHAAADCEYNFQWYGDLVGGYFKSHPKQQEAKAIVVDKNNPATQGLSDPWIHFDELYNYKYYNPGIKVLLKLDETSYTGGANGDNHPIAWYHDFEGGRSFYTGFGHTNECWADSLFLHHLLAGIQYAMGKK